MIARQTLTRQVRVNVDRAKPLAPKVLRETGSASQGDACEKPYHDANSSLWASAKGRYDSAPQQLKRRFLFVPVEHKRNKVALAI